MSNKFDYLIAPTSKVLSDTFLHVLSLNPEFKEDVETAPLLNMTIGTFMSSLINILNTIKKTTPGEEKLIDNIELTINSLTKAIEDLPFVSNVEIEEI
jgi:hypothetical protein